MKRRDQSGTAKVAERQTKLAGKRPYHRVAKANKARVKAQAEVGIRKATP